MATANTANCINARAARHWHQIAFIRPGGLEKGFWILCKTNIVEGGGIT